MEDRERFPQVTEGVAQTQEADTQEVQRIQALEERERQVEIKERQLQAERLLKQRRLPEEMLPLMDCGSQEALEKSLQHAEKLRDALVVNQAPRLMPPSQQAGMTYAQRAALFIQNGGQYTHQ